MTSDNNKALFNVVTYYAEVHNSAEVALFLKAHQQMGVKGVVRGALVYKT